jgi:hypothetical protein
MKVNKMKPSGIHLLLTYKCNASCDHCFLSCGPKREGLITLEETRKYVEDAAAAPYVDHFFIEGGEPFLYPGLLKDMVAEISGRGFWLGLLTNGFWASSDSRSRRLLKPLADAGLRSLGVSTDAWHTQFVPVERAERAIRIAGELGLNANLMVCKGGPEDNAFQEILKDAGHDFYASGLICRGRAATNSECRVNKHKWQKLKVCPDTFGGDSRVHLGPGGQIHLCQGLLLGRDARVEPLSEIFAGFKVEEHPVCAALNAGGPAGLARLAMEYGFVPEEKYADGCQLCFEARRHLLPCFPYLIGPAEMYEDSITVPGIRAAGN